MKGEILLNDLILQLIEDNYVAVVITAFLMIFAYTNNNFEKNKNRMFLAAAYCILLLIIEEAWEAQLALRAKPTMLRVLLSAIGYSLRPMIPFFLCLTNKRYTRKQLFLLLIPLVYNGLVAFSALFSSISFSYSPDNHFVRGPLGITPFLIAAFYIAVLLYQTTRSWRKGGMKEAMILTAIVMLAFLSTVLESIFGFQFIQNPSMATSVTFFYLFLHSNQNNRDPLTGALTRRRFYLDADKHSSTLTAVISLDLNNLKTLNDQYGHLEGDRALTGVTDIIQHYMGTHSSLYRTGGDEFMILCYKMKAEAVETLIEKIRNDLSNTKYRCAIGYVLYTQQMNIERACQIADSVMYENKRLMKAESREKTEKDG